LFSIYPEFGHLIPKERMAEDLREAWSAPLDKDGEGAADAKEKGRSRRVWGGRGCWRMGRMRLSRRIWLGKVVYVEA